MVPKLRTCLDTLPSPCVTRTPPSVPSWTRLRARAAGGAAALTSFPRVLTCSGQGRQCVLLDAPRVSFGGSDCTYQTHADLACGLHPQYARVFGRRPFSSAVLRTLLIELRYGWRTPQCSEQHRATPGKSPRHSAWSSQNISPAGSAPPVSNSGYGRCVNAGFLSDPRRVVGLVALGHEPSEQLDQHAAGMAMPRVSD